MEGAGMSSSKGRGPNRPVNPRSFTEAYLQFAKKNFNVDHRPPETKHNKTDIKDSKPHIAETKMKTRDMARRKDEFGLPPQVKASIQAEMNHRTWRHTAARPKERKQKVNRSKDMFVASLPPTSQESLPEFARIRFTEHRNSAINSRTRRIRIHDEMEPNNRPVFNGWNFPQLTSTGPRRSGPALPVSQTHAVNLSTKKDNSASLNGRAHRSLSETAQNSEEVIEIEDLEEDDISTPVQRIGCFNKKFEYPIRKFVSRGHVADEVIEIEDLEEGKLFDEFVTNPRNIKQTPRLTKSGTKELSHRGVLSLDQHTPQQQFLGSHRARRQVSKNTNPSKYREDYSKIESAEFNFYLTDEDDSVDENDEESESDGEDESESESEVGSESGAKGKEDGDLVLTIEESDASDDTSDDDEIKLSDDGMCKPCITSTGTCQDRKHLCMGRGRARGRVKSRGRGSSINKPTVTRQSVGPAESVTSVTIKPISGPQTGVPDAIESAELDTPIISPPDPPTVSPVSLGRGRGRGRGGGRGRGRGRGRGGCATIDTAPAPEPRATRSTRASNPRLLRSAGGDGDDRPSKPEDSTTPNIGDTGVHKQYHAVHEEKHDMNDKAIKTEQNCVSSVDSSSSITAVPSHGDDSKELDIFKSVDLIPQGSCIPSALPQLAQADIEASLNCLITEDDEDINEPIAESVDLSDLRPESPLPPVPFDLPEKGVDQTRFPTINSGFTGIECTRAARVVSVTTSPVSQLCTDSSSRSRFPPSLDDTARRKKIRDLMQEKERLGTLLAAESAPRLLNSNLNVNTEAKAEVRKVTIKKITKKKKKESISSNETPCLLDSTLEDAVSRNSSVDVTGVAVEHRFDQPIQKPASTQSNLPPEINTTCTVKEGTTRKKKTKKDLSPPSDLTVLSPSKEWKVSPDCTVDESVLNAVAAGDLGKPRSPAPSAGFDKNGTWIGLPPPSPTSILPAPVNKQCQKQSQLHLQETQRPHRQQLRPHPAAAHSQQQPNNIVSVHPSQLTAQQFSGVPHQQQQLLHQYQEQHAIPQTTSSTIAQVERQLPTRQEQPVLPSLGQIQPVQPALDQVQPELPDPGQARSSLPGQVPPSVIAPLTVTTSDLHGNPLHSNDSFTTGSASLTPGSTISSTQDLSELNKKKRRKRRKNELEQNKATQQEVEAMVQAIYARVGVPKHASPDDSQLMQAKDIQTETPIVLQKSVPVSTGVSPVAPNSQRCANDTLQTTVDAANQQSVRIVKPAADKVKKKRRKKKEAEGVTAAEMEPPLPVPNQEWVQEQLQIAQNQPLSDSLPPPMPASSAGNHPPPSEPARNMARSTQATSSTHTSTLATINRSMAMTDINQVLSSSTSLAMSHCSLHTSVADAAIVSRAGAALRRGPQIQPHQLNVHNPPTSTAASEIYAGTFPNQGNVTHSKPPGYENVFALQEPNKLSEKFDELFSSVLNSPILESVVENAAVSLNTTTTQTGLGQSYMQGYPSTNTILATASGNTSAMLPSVVQQQVSLNSGVSMQSFNSVRNSTISTTMPSVSGGYMQATKLGDSSVFTASSENAWNTKSSTAVAEIGSDSFKVDMDAPEMKGVFKSGPDADLVERLRRNQQEQIPSCNCLDHYDESVEGPYYTHLGAGPDVPAVRRLMEQRLGISGKALRLEKVVFTNKEGKSPQGCPIAKWIIRRSGPEEKVLCVVRERPRHTCNTAVMVLGTVVWDGVPEPQANQLYDYLCNVLPENGHETERRCGTNDRKNCACQGWNGQTGGASFSFGCSWSMYYNGCKFARSAVPRKFRLKDDHHEPILESHLQRLATDLGPLYKNVAPDSFRNMTQFEDEASACRLGLQPGRPFSGVTAVVDYCAHAHKDIHNMNNGCTVVVTLTKPESRNVKRPLDEQLHVLPLCVLDPYDEFGSSQSQYQKIQEGAIDWLTKYPVTMRIRSTPLLSKAKRRRLAKLASCGRGGRGKLPKGGLTSLARAKCDGYPSHTNASLGRGRGSPRGKGVLRSPYSGAGGLGAQTAPRGVLTNPTRGGFTPHIPGSSPFWNPKNRAHPILNKSASVMSSPKMLSPKQRKLVFKLADGKKFRFGKNGSVIKVRRRIVNARQDYDQLEAMEIGGVKQAWEVMTNGSYDVSSSNQSQSVNQQVNAAAMAQRGGLPGGSTAYSEQRHGTPNALPGSNPPLPNQGPRLDLKSQNLAAYNRQQSGQAHSNQTHSNQYTQSGERAQYGDSQNNAQRQFSAQDPDEGTGNLQHWFDNFCDSMDVQPLGPDLSVENPSDMLTEELDKYAQPSRPNQNCLQGQRLLQNSNCQSQPVNNTHNNHSLGHSNVASMYSHGSQPFSSFPKRPVSNGQSYEHQQQQQPHQQQQQQRQQQQQQQQQQHYQQHVYKSPQAYPVRPGSHEGIVPTPFQTPSHPPSQRSGGWGQERPPSNHSHATPTAVVPDPAIGQRTTHGGQQAAYHVQNNAQSQNSSVPVRAVGNMHQLQPNVANQHNNHHFDSPLDLLSEAAAMQVKTEQMANHWTDNQNPNGSWSQELTPQSTPTKDYSTSDTSPEKQPEPKPTEVKTNCEDNFKDNSIGGVAIALTHGSVLFECAKRELHATTALKTPNRVHPTRISLVFYQHKSLNATEHGTIDFVEKSEMWKQRREAKKAEELGVKIPEDMIKVEPKSPTSKVAAESSSVAKRGRGRPRKRPLVDKTETDTSAKHPTFAPYRYQLDANVRQAATGTTTTVSTKWIHPKLAISGPYQRWF